MGECYALENVPLNVEPADPKAARFNGSTLYRRHCEMQVGGDEEPL